MKDIRYPERGPRMGSEERSSVGGMGNKLGYREVQVVGEGITEVIV